MTNTMMRNYIYILFFMIGAVYASAQNPPKITTTQIQNLIVDSTRINATGDTAYYYQNGVLIGTGPIAGGGGGTTYNNISEGNDTVYISDHLVVDTFTLYVDADSNRIGINTNNPQYRMEFSYTGATYNGHFQNGLIISNDDPSYNVLALALNSKTKNANFGFLLNDTVKAAMTYDTRGFIGFINSVYNGNDFSLRLNDDGSLQYFDYPSQTTSFKIEADGDVYMPRITNNSSGDYDLRITTTGELVYQISSVRFKENITDFEKGLDYVLQLRPVKFNYITDSTDTKLVGFIAEQLSEIGLEEGVVYKTDGTVEGINNTIYNPILVNAIKEQQAIIESQATEIEQLKSQIQLILSEIEQIKNN